MRDDPIEELLELPSSRLDKLSEGEGKRSARARECEDGRRGARREYGVRV